MSNQPPGQLPFEQQKWAHEIGREDAKTAHGEIASFWEKINEAAIKSAETALRTAILINGGAAVSILAFIGGLIAKDKITVAQLNDVSSSLMFFAFGVTAALLAMALSYFVNYATVEHTASFKKQSEHPYVVPGPRTKLWARVKTALHILAVIVGLASVVCFVWGMFDVRNSIARLAG